MEKEKYFVTTAIDYPNGNPHIGHAYEKIITDIFARWHRLKGDDVFFSTGTDEHGQKIEKYAKDSGKTPKQFVDEMAQVYKDFCTNLSISHDRFIRTTDEHHEKYCQEIFDKTLQKGDIYLGNYTGNYCIFDETFFTEKDLVDGKKCPQCGRDTQLVEEESYFFKLGSYKEAVIKFIEDNNFIVPETRQNEILSRLKNDDLRDLCVSRTSFKWGIPLLNNPKHVIYVWYDALMNYVTATEYPIGKYSKYWPADAHVVGKDIIWFHAVIWPAMLMSAGIPLPKKLYVHGFILDQNGEKMSKSKGNVVDPVEIMTKYGSDPLRYYLAKAVPSSSDGNFSEAELVKKYNTELANDLGNLVARCLKLTIKNSGNKCVAPSEYINELKDAREKAFLEANRVLVKFEYDKALEYIWAYVKKINAYLTEKEPWKIKDKDQFNYVMYTAIDNLATANAMLEPFIPNTADKIIIQLGNGQLKVDDFDKNKEFYLTDNEILFPKIEFVEKKVFPLNLKVAKILDVQPHPDATKLLVIQISLGEEKRQLVAGLREFYSPEELVGKHVVMVSNLEPAKLRGIESNGMILAGESKVGDKTFVKVLTAEGVLEGTSVGLEGYENNNSKIKYDEFKKLSLIIKDNKIFVNELNLKTLEKDKSNSKDVSVELVDGKVY
jgi:methionyl-tRNA synthetase